jgi:hypothetical protein
MAIVVLVLWLFTAGAGFYLLVTSNLSRARPAQAPSVTSTASEQPAPATQDALVTQAAPAFVSPPAAGAPSGSVGTSAGPAPRRTDRDQFAPASLVASRQAPIVPDLGSVAEFAHPAFGISGLGFWLGFTLVHYRVLGWIAFGLIVATACIGLAWFTANTRAARRDGNGQPAPRFTSRLIIVHGSGAAVTLTLAALTALVLRG